MQKQTHVRRHRKIWALSQDDLARLIGLTQGQMSRIERGHSEPEISTVLALHVVFGKGARALFSSMYRKVEAEVMAVAAVMDEELSRKKDRASRRKVQLLLDMVKRSDESTNGL